MIHRASPLLLMPELRLKPSNLQVSPTILKTQMPLQSQWTDLQLSQIKKLLWCFHWTSFDQKAKQCDLPELATAANWIPSLNGRWSEHVARLSIQLRYSLCSLITLDEGIAKYTGETRIAVVPAWGSICCIQLHLPLFAVWVYRLFLPTCFPLVYSPQSRRIQQLLLYGQQPHYRRR